MFEISPTAMSVGPNHQWGRVQRIRWRLTLRSIEPETVDAEAEEVVSVLRQPAANVFRLRGKAVNSLVSNHILTV